MSVVSSQQQGAATGNTGRLVVQVFTADQTRPIEGAHVTVTKETPQGEELLKALLTDADGRTDVINLSAPSKDYSLAPNEPRGFSSYNIRVDYPGYYTAEQINVPVFPDITSIQQVPLIPLPLDTYTGKKKTFISEPLESVEAEDRRDTE